MSVFNIGDTIMLETDDIFQVMEIVEFEGEDYLYVIEAPEDIVEAIDPKDMKFAFLKEIVDEETEEAYVEKVEDIELIKTLTQEVLEEIG